MKDVDDRKSIQFAIVLDCDGSAVEKGRKYTRIQTPINDFVWDAFKDFSLFFSSFSFEEITNAIKCCNGKGLKSLSLFSSMHLDGVTLNSLHLCI